MHAFILVRPKGYDDNSRLLCSLSLDEQLTHQLLFIETQIFQRLHSDAMKFVVFVLDF